MKKTETAPQHTDSWHSDKWETFFRHYRRLYSKYQSTDLIDDDDVSGHNNDTPEIEIEESSTQNEVSETIIDLEGDRELKKGYSASAGYYFNYINVDMFKEQSKTFIFDYADLQDAAAFGINPVTEGVKTLVQEDIGYMDTQLRFYPENAMQGMREAVYRIMKDLHHEYAMEIKDEFKARFKNIPVKVSLSDITNKHIGHLYTFEGFVTAVDEETRLLYLTTKWICPNNHITEVEGREKPSECKQCNKRYLDKLPDGQTETYQEFRLQQRHDQTQDGRIAVERDVVLIGDDIVNKIQGGDYIEMTGIVKVRDNVNRRKNNDIADFYIEASFVEVKPDDTMMIPFSAQDSLFLEDQVKEAVHLETEDLDFEKLKLSVVPTVIGHEIVKMAVLLQMASSDSRTFVDGTPHRGNICILFCGSPSTAKTVIAEYVKKVHIRGIMPKGKGVSVAGLTATVDTKVSPPRLYAGAYLMAKNGIVVIDEMQTLDEDILSVLLEACEDSQTITITKAGLHRPLKADCASLHLSNPKKTAVWDDTKNIIENTGFKPNLLSRYDSVIVFRDIPDTEEDKKKAEHWMKIMSNSKRDWEIAQNRQSDRPKYRRNDRNINSKSGLYSIQYMAMWLRYVRKTFHPVLKPGSEAYQIIQNFYLNFRKTDARWFAQIPTDAELGVQKFPSITMRQLAALYRWAEASARAHHRNTVEAKDAEIACQIVKFSIMNSGFNPITKHATSIEDEMTPSRSPKVTEMDIIKFSELTKDKFYHEAARKFRKFEHVVTRRGINRCIYCKGTGEIIEYGEQKDCTQCQGFGCVNIEFSLSDIEDALHPAGFTRADVEYIAGVFEKRNLISRSKYNQYSVAQRYSYKNGWRGIKMLDTNIELAMDLDGSMQKLGILEAGMSEEDRQKLLEKIGQDLSES